MFRSVLLSLDFDSDMDRLIQPVLEIAEKFGSRVWILHVAAPEPDFVGYAAGPKHVRDFRADELRREHRFLQRLAANFRTKGIQADGLLIEGATSEMILEECEKLKIDLICIGHRRHTWWQKLLEVHTDLHIIDRVGIPVLTIPVD